MVTGFKYIVIEEEIYWIKEETILKLLCFGSMDAFSNSIQEHDALTPKYEDISRN